MKKIPIQIALLAGALFAFSATAQIQYSNEFWISTNATGNTYPNGGTLDSPLDGSTQTKFDQNMASLPASSMIHILPGTYQTFGDEEWLVKTEQKIVGSGIDVTIIQLATNAPEEGDGTYVIASRGLLNAGVDPVTNAVVSDLTVDCNWTSANGNITRNGVGLDGTQNSVRRVKVEHTSYGTNYSSEAWGIAIDNTGLPDSIGNLIEDCEVDPISSADGGGMSSLSFDGGGTNPVSGIIKDNKVYGPGLSINGSWDYNMIIEGNYVDGGNAAVYGDTGGCTNMLITHNIFKNCMYGVFYGGYGDRNNITIDFNSFQITSSATPTCVFNLWPGGLPNPATNIVIFGNTISIYGPSPTATIVFAGQTNVASLIFADNTIDPTIASNQATTSYYSPGINVHMYNNYDLYGNYIPWLNIPELGGVPVSSLGLNLISSSQPSTVLTNLGLPSNPLTVVTNNESGVTLSGTFSGNGSGLTNLSASLLAPVCFGTIRWNGNPSFSASLTNSEGCSLRNTNSPYFVISFTSRLAANTNYIVLGTLPITPVHVTTSNFTISGEYFPDPTNWNFVVFSQ